MKEVDTHNPQIKLTLYKTIGRKTLNGNDPVSTRFNYTDDQIDLSPYLGDGSSVLTSKSVREPAGGFTISLTDRPYENLASLESLYGVIEPMDVVEIRIKHAADGNTLIPVVMRGFISEVRRSETMNADGRPQRNVVLVGQDYGKIWQMLQVLFLPNYVIGESLITGFKLYERYGGGFTTELPSHQYIREMFEKIINDYLSNLMPDGTPNPNRFLLDRIVDDGGLTDVTSIQNQQGTFYNLMKTYTDVGIWNELFIEDDEDGVHVVFRPIPTLKLDGKTKIQAKAPDPVIIPVAIDRVINMTLSRSDANVANFYWVRGPRFDLNNDVYRQLYAIQKDDETVYLNDYPNTNIDLYGLREMYGETQTGPASITTHGSGPPEDKINKTGDDMFSWIEERRHVMVEQNRDNVVLEHGTMRVFGNEKIRAGTYIKLERGAFSALYYVVQVDHSFVPFNGFVSTLTLERGLGFVERAKMGSGRQSPWIAERTVKS